MGDLFDPTKGPFLGASPSHKLFLNTVTGRDPLSGKKKSSGKNAPPRQAAPPTAGGPEATQARRKTLKVASQRQGIASTLIAGAQGKGLSAAQQLLGAA